MRRLLRNSLISLKMIFSTTPVLDLLPKIHKSLTNSPWRPIISSNESPLEPLTQFVDFYIRYIVKALPSYVADTGDVLRQLKDITLPEQALFVNFDVESLYTISPTRAGSKLYIIILNMLNMLQLTYETHEVYIGIKLFHVRQ